MVPWKTSLIRLCLFDLTLSLPSAKKLNPQGHLLKTITGNFLTVRLPEAIADNSWGKQQANQKASKEKLRNEMSVRGFEMF